MQTKLLAVMFTDIQGYTAKSSIESREGLTAMIQQQQELIKPILERYNGRLVKWIGDAALAVFESATDAILCGHQIQSNLVADLERAAVGVRFQIKVVVHLGDVIVDHDGDVYGNPVNYAARLEKLAKTDEVYFSSLVREAISSAEIPYEEVGVFELKGIREPARVCRTCFGQSPVIRDNLALVNTDVIGTIRLAELLGWDTFQPRIDKAIGAIVAATREYGGSCRGVSGDGTFLSFTSMTSTLNAISQWTATITEENEKYPPEQAIWFRIGIHWGTLHVMEHTLMGKDMHLSEKLTRLGNAGAILLSGEASQMSDIEGIRFGVREPLDPESCDSDLAIQD